MGKAKSASGKFVVWLLAVVFIIAVVCIALFFILRERGLTNYVEYNGERYFLGSDGGELFLRRGKTHEFSVKSLTGGEVDFDVKIMSNVDNNIAFAYNGEYHNSYTGNAEMDDYTNVFDLQADTDGFAVTISQNMTLETAIETKLNGDITLLDEFSDRTACFVITVTVGNSSVVLPFAFGAEVSDVTLNPPSIIF